MKMAEQDDLELMFAQARAQRPSLPDALAVRIETDAEAVRLQRQGAARPASSGWRHLLAMVGGWSGFSGVAVAGAAGVWIGFSAPAFLPDPANFLVSQEVSFLVADLSLDLDYLEDTE